MKNQIGQMMHPGFQTKHLAVEHVGDPCDWMPVAGMEFGEGPNQALFGKTCPHIGISSYICVIIEGHKLITSHLPVDRKNSYN